MTLKPKRIVVTGAAGQISYSLLFRIAMGDLLGHHQPIILSLVELPMAIEALKGVVMELQDCAFPLLHGIEIHSNLDNAYEGADFALLVGAKPRGPGMERKDLLKENGKIFVEQGRAMNRSASKEIRVLVVGNPCNTNCLVTMHNAPDIPRENFFAMMRLDQNRAQYQLAHKANVHHTLVENIIVWGNHSATQVPDFTQARICGERAEEVIQDRHWLETGFFSIVQQRGAKIIEARGKSSAASAAAAAIDSIQSLQVKSDQLFSMAVLSDGNPYGIQKDLVFSFPLMCTAQNQWEIQGGIKWDSFIEQKIKLTERELIEEREAVRDYLK